MRAVLLPTPGDPFLIKYWLENFNKYYRDSVDKLYIYLNTPIEKEVVDYIKSLFHKDPKITYVYINQQIEHGDALNALLEIVEEDHLMLVEDDAFVFKKDIVDICFRLVESGKYDIVGSKRGSCSDEISRVAKERWELDYSGMGDQGCNFWPCYFFCKTDALRRTDRKFGARAWKKGELIEPLDHVVDDDVVCGDTFVNTSLQLRNRGYKMYFVPQYHGSPYDLEHFDRNDNLWNGEAFWTHVGSLSSGVGGVLMNDLGISLVHRKTETKRKTINIPNAGMDEWARRIQWWSTFFDNADDSLGDFKKEYGEAISRLQRYVSVPDKLIARRKAIYKLLGL